MSYEYMWAVEHALSWKDDPDRWHEVTLAVFESKGTAIEWLRQEAAFRGWASRQVHLDELEGELRYETEYSTGRFTLISMPYYQKGSIADA